MRLRLAVIDRVLRLRLRLAGASRSRIDVSSALPPAAGDTSSAHNRDHNRYGIHSQRLDKESIDATQQAPSTTAMPITMSVKLRVVCWSGQATFLISVNVSRYSVWTDFTGCALGAGLLRSRRRALGRRSGRHVGRSLAPRLWLWFVRSSWLPSDLPQSAP